MKKVCKTSAPKAGARTLFNFGENTKCMQVTLLKIWYFERGLLKKL